MSFICTTCGKPHTELPDLGTDKPDTWWSVPEAEREHRIVLTSDTCVIDQANYYIRGVLLIPIHDHPNAFGFGVWVSQKRENFERYLANFDSADIGPFFGWLCSRVGYFGEDDRYPLKTMVHFRGNGSRPIVQLEPDDHPLAVAQREGISLAKAWEIVHHYVPPN
jgi:hypothetical protein